MTHEEEQRFEMLRAGPCAAPDYLRDYYGIRWPLSGPAGDMFASYIKAESEPARCSRAGMSRFDLEDFMSLNKLLPKKWAAARLGTTETSLNAVLKRLGDIGMYRPKYVLGGFIDEGLSTDLTHHIASIRSIVFSDHNSWCKRVHAELRKALGVAIEPLYCATSDTLDEKPRQLAYHFDCLTCEPLSTRHSVWLNFRKPLYLPSDCCSKLFYGRNRDRMARFIEPGSEPDHMELYEEFLQSAAHA